MTEESRVTIERMERAFDALPHRCQYVFWMHRRETMTYAQIGERMGVAPIEVQHIMAEALYRLTRSIDDQERGYTPGPISRLWRMIGDVQLCRWLRRDDR